MFHRPASTARLVFLRALRALGALCALGGPAVAHAAFELTGEWPASFASGPIPVTVLRESLEERSSTLAASATAADGKFRVRVDAADGLFTLQAGDHKAPFVASAGQSLRAVPTADGAGLRVEGGADQTLFANYETFRTASLARTVLSVRDAIRVAREANNAAEIDRLTEAEVVGYRTHRRELNDHTLAHLRGSPALYAASLRWDGDHRLEELAETVRAFSAAFPGLEIARLMEERIARFRATAIGALAPALAGPGPDGAIVTLEGLRGRYVLVDFWASWCPPCRLENRRYAELHRRHRADGFEILAVSVDQNAGAWKAAIAKDEARWLHLSDLTGWKTPLAARYNVTALPASFLLDPAGRIVAKDVRGEALDTWLAARLKPSLSP